jgi:hypothetical protein
VKVTDELGLVLENEHIAAFVPSTSKAFVFRVRSRANRGFERLHYGPLPIRSGTALSVYGGGTVTVPADGVMPGNSYVPLENGLSFPTDLDVFDKTDMWYVPVEWRERLFHVILSVAPSWLRCQVDIPKGVAQPRFQRGKVSVGVEKGFGFSRGRLEVLHFPGLHYGYRFGNDSNLNVHTSATFTYGEYVVEIPKDANLIFDVLTRKVPSYWLTMPIFVYDDSIRRAFLEAYGIEGFPLYPINKRAEAVAEYEKLLKEVKV